MFPTTESSGWLPNVDKCFRFPEISTFGLQDKINSKIIYIFSNISNLSGNKVLQTIGTRSIYFSMKLQDSSCAAQIRSRRALVLIKFPKKL